MMTKLHKVKPGVYATMPDLYYTISDGRDYGIDKENAFWIVTDKGGRLVGFAYSLSDIKAGTVETAIRQETATSAEDCAVCRNFKGHCEHPCKREIGFWDLPIERCWEHKRSRNNRKQ
jgi:glycerol-3-phosphate dehydrogenase